MAVELMRVEVDYDGPTLEVYLLGQISFDDALRLQRRLVFEVSGSGGRLAALVLCEHPPIITVGRLGSWAHIDSGDESETAPDMPVRWVNRGGGCQLLVPGQIVAYPIVPLEARGLGIDDYVTRLERSVIETLDEFSVRATTRPGHAGLWADAGQIASIGVAVSRWVSYHGITINVSGQKSQFRVLHPDGNGAARMTTMDAERLRPTPVAKVREALVRRFVENFELPHYNLYSHHPMLTPARVKHAYARSV